MCERGSRDVTHGGNTLLCSNPSVLPVLMWYKGTWRNCWDMSLHSASAFSFNLTSLSQFIWSWVQWQTIYWKLTPEETFGPSVLLPLTGLTHFPQFSWLVCQSSEVNKLCDHDTTLWSFTCNNLQHECVYIKPLSLIGPFVSIVSPKPDEKDDQLSYKILNCTLTNLFFTVLQLTCTLLFVTCLACNCYVSQDQISTD